MSIESIDAAIESLLMEFNVLNGDRFNHNKPYVGFPIEIERVIGKLADEIARLRMAKSVLGANSLVVLGNHEHQGGCSGCA